MKAKKKRHTERLIALCLHDVRVSRGIDSIEIIRLVMDSFKLPLTVHLVFDEMLKSRTPLYKFLIDKVNNEELEIVFHGITHKLAKKVGRLYAFYHKYEAEYLADSESLRTGTKKAFLNLTNIQKKNAGICPACWLSTKKNSELFNSLEPVYIESLFSLRGSKGKIFSPIISLASTKLSDLLFLKTFAWIMYYLSSIMSKSKVRMAIHPCDIKIENSMELFFKIIGRLKNRNFQGVLQKDLYV